MPEDDFPANTWLTRHPRIALVLVALVILLWTGADGLLALELTR